MSRFRFALLVVISVCGLSGCGDKALGPADPKTTPVVSQEEINKSIEKSMSSMPEAQRKQYEQMMKNSGSK